MSGNFAVVREMSGNRPFVRGMTGKKSCGGKLVFLMNKPVLFVGILYYYYYYYYFMYMVCHILGLCCLVNCNVCMFLLWLPYGVINYNN